MFLRTLFVLLFALSALLSCEQATEPEAVQTAAAPAPSADPLALIETEGLLQRIGTLASDEFGGRAPMSEGERLTLAYLETQFREMGLEPMFGDSYRQPVPLVAIEGIGDQTLRVADADGNTSLDYANGPESAVWTTRIVEQTGLDASELVWAGYGIVAPESSWSTTRVTPPRTRNCSTAIR
jgi:hypothetical protein